MAIENERNCKKTDLKLFEMYEIRESSIFRNFILRI